MRITNCRFLIADSLRVDTCAIRADSYFKKNATANPWREFLIDWVILLRMGESFKNLLIRGSAPNPAFGAVCLISPTPFLYYRLKKWRKESPAHGTALGF